MERDKDITLYKMPPFKKNMPERFHMLDMTQSQTRSFARCLKNCVNSLVKKTRWKFKLNTF